MLFLAHPVLPRVTYQLLPPGIDRKPGIGLIAYTRIIVIVCVGKIVVAAVRYTGPTRPVKKCGEVRVV